MQTPEIKAILEDAIACAGSEKPNPDLMYAQLEACFTALHNKSLFKNTGPGEPLKLMSFAVMQAQDAVAAALDQLRRRDIADAVKFTRQALYELRNEK